VCGFLLARWLPERFTSHGPDEVRSLLRVEPGGFDLFGLRRDLESNFDRFLATQVELIASPSVLRAALIDPKFAGLEPIKGERDPEQWLRQHLRVEILPKTHLITVSMPAASSLSRVEQALVINNVVDVYLYVAHTYSSERHKFYFNKTEEYYHDLLKEITEREDAILRLEDQIANARDEAEKREERRTLAKIKFIEAEIRHLQEKANRVDLVIEQFKFDSRGEAQIKVIDKARF